MPGQGCQSKRRAGRQPSRLPTVRIDGAREQGRWAKEEKRDAIRRARTQYRLGQMLRTTEIDCVHPSRNGCFPVIFVPYWSRKPDWDYLLQKRDTMVPRLTLILWLLVLAPIAHAGMILDGVSDSLYRAHGAQFPAVGKVGTASGVLIAPNWVLTAAHVSATNFVAGGQTYSVAQEIKHPQYVANGSSINYGYDISLVRLTTSVVGIAPIPIYTGTNELGAVISMTGYGATGVGSNGVFSNAGTLRGGTNDVDLIDSFANGSSGQIGAQNAILVTDFDPLASFDSTGKYNTLGTTTPTSLEYQLCFGDSGGAGLIQEGGKWYVAGIHSWVDSQKNWTGKPNDSTLLFGYGAVSGMTRVTNYQDFIFGHTGVPEPSTLAMVGLAGLAGWMARSRTRRRSKPSSDPHLSTGYGTC
jgi:hypothetical protein